MMTTMTGREEPSVLLEAQGVSKAFAGVQALADVAITVERGQVTCLLGDNGAGKSTLIKILSGVIRPDSGRLLVDGEEANFKSPRAALDRGVATVFQDLAVVPIMPVYRNFFLGREPTRGVGPLRWFDVRQARKTAREQLQQMGIDIQDVNRPVQTLSGGQRQCVAIARAMHFGARVLILDEPTSALGVKEAELVLKHILKARGAGIGVVLITHNVQHAYPVGDAFVILRRGRMEATVVKDEVTVTELEHHMAGGQELERLKSDLSSFEIAE